MNGWILFVFVYTSSTSQFAFTESFHSRESCEAAIERLVPINRWYGYGENIKAFCVER